MFKKLESKAWNTIKNVFFCISAWLLSWLSFVEFQSSISCCSPKSDEDEGLKCQHYDSRGSPRLAICCHYCNPQMSPWVISVHINVVSCQLNRWRNFSHGSSEDKIVKQLSRESFFKTYCTFLAVLLCKNIVFCCVFQSLEQFIWTRVEVIKKVLKSDFFFVSEKSYFEVELTEQNPGGSDRSMWTVYHLLVSRGRQTLMSEWSNSD